MTGGRYDVLHNIIGMLTAYIVIHSAAVLQGTCPRLRLPVRLNARQPACAAGSCWQVIPPATPEL